MAETHDPQAPQPFNPNLHVIQLKSKEGAKDYLPVQWRLVWFREQCPEGTIDTEELEVDLDREVEAEAFVWNNEKRRSEKVIKRAKGYARFKAIVADGHGRRSTGTGSETAVDFADFVEKAETKAIGRALAGLGYGTQFAPDFNEGTVRIVDSPVERSSTPQQTQQEEQASKEKDPAPVSATTAPSAPSHAQPQQPVTSPPPSVTPTVSPITPQQKNSIEKLYQHLGEPLPETVDALSYAAAKQEIQDLTARYRAKKDTETSHALSSASVPSPIPDVKQGASIDVQTIKAELKKLTEGLSSSLIKCLQEDRQAALGLPVSNKEWTPQHFQDALTFTRAWCGPVTPPQVEALGAFLSEMPRAEVQRLYGTLSDNADWAKRPYGMNERLLSALRRMEFLYLLSDQVDTEGTTRFAYCVTTFKVPTPLSLYGRGQDLLKYTDHLREQITRGRVPSEPFQARFAKEYQAFLAGDTEAAAD